MLWVGGSPHDDGRHGVAHRVEAGSAQWFFSSTTFSFTSLNVSLLSEFFSQYQSRQKMNKERTMDDE